MLPRTALVILGLLAATLLAMAGSEDPFQLWRAQMAAGKACMESLTGEDILEWIERTKTLLLEYEPGARGIGVYGTDKKPVPPELAELKIIRIDVFEDHVNYVWMGGMDHTYLEVKRLSNGTFRFTARYDEAESKVIWPRE
ncbi:MAG: hypothetical protein DMF06_15525 [Verrucomicrobia bacterium]|nr:MAG: hypothetical protein DMF06_15525 [Verrucomicrobiota bacterium]